MHLTTLLQELFPQQYSYIIGGGTPKKDNKLKGGRDSSA